MAVTRDHMGPGGSWWQCRMREASVRERSQCRAGPVAVPMARDGKNILCGIMAKERSLDD